jgi:HEPN domain-containing protein
MLDIQKQIAYWVKGAKEDWKVAQELVERRRKRHGLFLAHLALEKVLKAHVCKNTEDLAPKIHSLSRLVDLTGLQPDQRQLEILGEMNGFQMEGRYPEFLGSAPTLKMTRRYMARTKEVFKWLIKML